MFVVDGKHMEVESTRFLEKLCKQMLRKDFISNKNKRVISHEIRLGEKEEFSQNTLNPIRHHTGPADWTMKCIVWLFSGKDKRVLSF